MITNDSHCKMNLPFVTVVMPVYNEGQFIASTIQQIVDQDYPADKFEVIVVDGMSTDNTRYIVRKFTKKHQNIRLLANPKMRSSAGRNMGFLEGNGEYFVVIDGHCFIPDTHLIENIVVSFEKSGADCLGRPQTLDPPGLSDFQKAVAIARASRIGHGGDSQIYSDCSGFVSPVSNGAAYRKEVFDKVGFVDETFDACEDVEFNYRVEKAGLSCYTAPSLLVKYYPRDSLWGLFTQLTRYGQGRRRFVHKHPDALTLNQLIPFFFVLGFGLLLILACTTVLLGRMTCLIGFVALPYVFYLCCIFLWALWSGRTSLFAICTLPLIIFVVHFSLGLGFLKESILILRRNNVLVH